MVKIETQMINDFLVDHVKNDNTRKQYLNVMERFVKFLGDKPFNRRSVNEYILHLKNKKVKIRKNQSKKSDSKKKKPKKLKDTTIDNNFQVLRVFAKWCYEEDFMTEKKYKIIWDIEFKVDKGRETRRHLTTAEIKKGLALKDPLKLMLFKSGISYGLRAQEYRNLLLKHVDLKKRILTIEKSKRDKTRQIRILKKHIPMWDNWFRTRKAYGVKHDYVFFTARGKAGSRSLERYFNQISVEIMGKPYEEQETLERITSHTLRYTYANTLYKGGVSIVLIQRMLGHQDIQQTVDYLKITSSEAMIEYDETAARVLA